MVYIDGLVAPVRKDSSQDAYLQLAEQAAPIFREHGAIRVVEGWGDDVKDGKVTDFRRAVQATDGETIVFSWVEWPDKAIRDAGMKKVMEDPRMQPGDDMPFDGTRMIFGGFQCILDV